MVKSGKIYFAMSRNANMKLEEIKSHHFGFKFCFLWSGSLNMMIYQGSGGHQGFQWGARMHQGVPGGSRLPLAPKRVIKQQNNDPKPWFKVPKVCPDPKEVVFTHLWGIWGHLGALKQWCLVKMPICQKPDFRKKIIQSLPQTTRCNFSKVSQFSIDPNIPRVYGKLPKKTFL